ncbi:MAG TPA: hypothetical protein VGC92_15995 [Phenylobacterium sp.]|jgi:hypothetical protein
MSKVSGIWRGGADHFEPDEDVDPQLQRQLRGHLEQIDYTAYVANRKVLGALGRADSQKFERLARSAALARTRWMAAALSACDGDHPPSPEQIDQIAQHRRTYEELTEVYGALRRLVERGYLAYTPAQPRRK